jgi:hypothetical protein
MSLNFPTSFSSKPETDEHKHLSGPYRDYYTKRFGRGEYRLIYRIDLNSKKVFLLKAGRRQSDTYSPLTGVKVVTLLSIYLKETVMDDASNLGIWQLKEQVYVLRKLLQSSLQLLFSIENVRFVEPNPTGCVSELGDFVSNTFIH